MTPVTKQAWIDALRSGKYVQGDGWLNKFDTHCCLGVLCEVAGLPKVPTSEDEFSFDFTELTGPVNAYDGPEPRLDDASIPLKAQSVILADLDLKKKVPSLDGLVDVKVSLASQLMDMNDSGRYSFEAIADYLETVE